MKLNESRRMARLRIGGLSRAALAICLVVLASAGLEAQAPDPDDWEFDVKTDKKTYAVDDTIAATAGIVAREDGAQGWSYGVKHDTNVLTIESVTSAGTDVGKVFKGGFEQTTIIEMKDTKVRTGYIQAVVLSLTEKAEVPTSAFFRMAAAKYRVNSGACKGKSGDFKTRIEYTEELAVPGSPPVELNITVDGKSLVPGDISGEEVTIQCKGVAPGVLALEFDDSDTDLVANKSSLYDLKVRLRNGQTKGSFDVQGWSYGVKFDTKELEAVSGEPGADSKRLHGGDGPDFKSYNLNDQSEDGKDRGVAVGAVIELDEPGTEVLELDPGDSKHLDTIKLRSRNIIPDGGPSKDVEIAFTDRLGGDRPLEVLIVVGGEGIVPDFSDRLTLTLRGGGAPGQPRFIRGDANNDAEVDIADGIWIINDLFYSGPETRCKGAADANDDDRVDISDAMFIFNYQLQPGRRPGNLHPRPSAPFPNCGTDSDIDASECPEGSTTCTD